MARRQRRRWQDGQGTLCVDRGGVEPGRVAGRGAEQGEAGQGGWGPEGPGRGRAEQGRLEPEGPGRGRAEQGGPEQGRVEQGHGEERGVEPGRAERDEPGRDRADRAAAAASDAGVVRIPLEVAASYRARTRGLLGRDGIEGALLLTPAAAVHTLRMRFAIDVAYLDRSLRVLSVRTMRPWRMGLVRPRSRHILEAEAGAMERWGLRRGGRVEVSFPDQAPEAT
jgi:uncharacterized protein